MDAIGELRRAIATVREIPGWSGDSANGAESALSAMEKNADAIATTLADLRTAMTAATETAGRTAREALRRLLVPWRRA
ncbi:hypothetical protein CW368_05485 [Actinomycetales bacterium SN12]|nr:hypothetical protein CW368_05485 [Actinomycetales bacterium SN12]